MARIDVTQDDATQAILERLRDQLQLGPDRCYEKTSPQALGPQPAAGWWLVVSYDGETYDEGMQFGGGANQLAVTADISVTLLTRIRLDKSGQDEELLRKAQRGLMPLKRKVLTALSGYDPVLPDGSTFARSFTIRGAGPFNYDDSKQVGWHTVRLAVMFDWDLDTSDE